MSIPLLCNCGKLIGEEDGMALLGGVGEGFCSCPGVDQHPKPARTEHSQLFGLMKKVTVQYPETYTSVSWKEYTGPANRFLLWCAIVFGTQSRAIGWEGVTVNGKWVWWNFSTGFYGDGLAELMGKK